MSLQFNRLLSVAKNFLWPSQLLLWWCATLMVFLAFNLIWCIDTGSFRPFTAYSSTYIFLPLCATVFTLPALFRKTWLQFIILIALSLLLVANLMYANTYYTAIPLYSYAMVFNLDGFGGSVLDSFRWYYLIIPSIPTISLFVVKPLKISILPPPHHLISSTKSHIGSRHNDKNSAIVARPGLYRLSYLIFLFILVSTAYMTFSMRGGFIARISSMNKNVVDITSVTPVYSVFCGLLYDYISSSQPVTREESIEIDDWCSFHESKFHNDTSTVVQPKKKVAFLIVESLESWPIGLSVNQTEITPFLNKIVTDSAVYYNPYVLTQTRDGRSIDAQLLYFAGMLPLGAGVYSARYPTFPFSTLPLEMRHRYGAETYLFTPDTRNTWNQKPVADAFGFENQFYNEAWTVGPGSVSPDGYILDCPFIEQSMTMVNSLWSPDNNGFAAWITHSLHNPFTLIPDSEKIISYSDIHNKVLRNYLNSVHYVDKAIGIFINGLRKRPDFNEITVVITGDHEALARHRDYMTANPSYDFVSPEMMTPLIIINSGHGGRDNKVIGQVDVYSTILDIVGLTDRYTWQGMGVSAFSDKHPRAAVNFMGATVGDSCDYETESHLKKAYTVSDRLFRLNHLPGNH